jgi:hypothetical protein
VKKALSIVLAAGLALAGVPLVGADVPGPDTVWGSVPASASAATSADLLDSTGKIVSTVPIVDGKFVFQGLPAGQYVVALQSATGQELARSLPAELGSGAQLEALFAPTAAAVPLGSTAPAVAGGIGRTGWILIGAAAVGITTAIVIAANDDDDQVASPSR